MQVASESVKYQLAYTHTLKIYAPPPSIATTPYVTNRQYEG